MISTEVLLGILAILGSLVGAYAFRIKNEAVAAKDAAEANALRIRNESLARLKEVESDADARKATAAQSDKMLAMMEKQIHINRQYRRQLVAQKESAEEGYRVIRDVQKDTNTELSNLYNQQKIVVQTLTDLPAKLQEINRADITDLAQMIGEKIGTAIVQEFTRQKVEGSMQPYPDPDDPLWDVAEAIPTTSEVTIRKTPAFSDDAMLRKPCAKIKAGGERIHFIAGKMPGWLMVYKVEGDSACWGWVPDYLLNIVKAEVVAVAAT